MDKLTLADENFKCRFCKTSADNRLNLGQKYKLGNVKAHYFCVLLSTKLLQKGTDNEGMLGFLLSDIQNELKRTRNMTCAYCKRKNATITCAARKCSKKFHLPCGLKNGSLHKFIDDFKSYCGLHRPIQNIPLNILHQAKTSRIFCCICYEGIDIVNKNDFLWAPCCVKTWYHRYCIQNLANSAGYFFRCAACNNVKKFTVWMKRNGIFVPQQDASWELVPNAFEELLFRHDSCDAEDCKCPQGRKKNKENTMWEIILCMSCGSQGMHIACGKIKFHKPEWECPGCESVTKGNKTSAEIVEISDKQDVCSPVFRIRSDVMQQKKRRRSSDDLENSILDKRKKLKMNAVEEEVEIDVETVDEEEKEKETQKEIPQEEINDDDIEVVEHVRKDKDVDEVLTAIKPGPLSYKISLIRQVVVDLKTPVKRNDTLAPEIIKLVDEEEEDCRNEDIQVIYQRNSAGEHVETTEMCKNVYRDFRSRALGQARGKRHQSKKIPGVHLRND